MSVHWGWVSVETLANKSPSVLVANLCWCNLDVVFQTGGSSREERPRQQYTYSIHRMVHGRERLRACWWRTSAQAVCVQSCNRAETSRGSCGISQEQVDSGGQVIIGLWLGLGGSEEPDFSHGYWLTLKTKSSREWMWEKRGNCTVPLVQHGNLRELWTTEVLRCQWKFPLDPLCVWPSVCVCVCVLAFTQAVEELLESLDLERSSYHMGLSRVSNATTCQTASLKWLDKPLLWISASLAPLFFFWKRHLLSGGVCLSLHLSLFEVCFPSVFGELPSLAPSFTLFASDYPRGTSLPCPTMRP